MKRILVLALFNLNMLCSTDGTLNTSFNEDGSRAGTFSTYVTSDSATSCQCLALAETPSGKILGAGRATVGGFTQAALMQLNGDGSLDTAFNSGGTKPGTYSAVLAGSVTSPVITSSIFNAVAIQNDGKIVAAGTSTGSGITNVLLARFNSDGSLDTSFGSSGSAVITINNTTGFSAKSVVLLSDNKILLGVARSASPVIIGIARFNSDGSLDTGFNSSGLQPGTYVLPAISGVPLSGSSSGTLAVDSDGKYIMGSSCTVSGFVIPIVIRLNTDLSLDTTFNTVGYKYFYFDETGSGTSVLGVKLQSDGKIIIFGNASFGTPAVTTKACIGRLNTDGTLDTSFNSIGSTSFLYGSSDAISTFSTAVALGLMENGKIVVSGRSSIGVSYIGIARLNSNGTLDTTFNSSGFVPGTNATTVNSGTASSICFSGALFGSSDFICGGTGSTTNQAIFADFKTLPYSIPGSIPVTIGQSVSLYSNTSIVISLQAYNSDGNTLEFDIVEEPIHGTLSSITQPSSGGTSQKASVTYTPNSGFSGYDAFSFNASNGSAVSSSSNVALAIVASGPIEPNKQNLALALIQKYY